LPVASASQPMFFGPVVAMALGVALGDAWPTLDLFAGGAIIVAALHGAELAERRAGASADARSVSGRPKELLKIDTDDVTEQELAEKFYPRNHAEEA